MPQRIPLNLSVPKEEDKDMIRQKADARGKTISEMVLEYFKRLPWNPKD